MRNFPATVFRNIDGRFRMRAAVVGLVGLTGVGFISASLAQVGMVRTIEGQVNVFSGKAECAPRYGLDVDEGDVVRTGEKAWAILSMMDGSKITVRPDTEVRIDTYRYTEAGESVQNQATFTLRRGAMRIVSGRIAQGRNTGYVINTPDASITLRGTDQDVAYIAPQFTPRGDALVGAYGKSYAGEAVIKNASGSLTIRDGQVAYVEPKVNKPPQLLTSDPYFYHWHSFIDRRASAVSAKQEPEGDSAAPCLFVPGTDLSIK